MKIIENPILKIPAYFCDYYVVNKNYKDCILNFSDGWVYDSSETKKIERINIQKPRNFYYNEEGIGRLDIKWLLDIKRTEKLYQSLKNKRVKIWEKAKNAIKPIAKNKDILVVWGTVNNEPIYYKVEWTKERNSFSYYHTDDKPDNNLGKPYKCQRFFDLLEFERKLLRTEGLAGFVLNKSINLHLSEKAENLCDEFNKKQFANSEYRMYVQEFLEKYHILTININGRKYRYLGEYKSFEPIDATEICV